VESHIRFLNDDREIFSHGVLAMFASGVDTFLPVLEVTEIDQKSSHWGLVASGCEKTGGEDVLDIDAWALSALAGNSRMAVTTLAPSRKAASARNMNNPE